MNAPARNPVAHRVFRTDRHACETEILRAGKELHDPLVGLSELRAVAFVEDEDHPLIFHRPQRRIVFVAADCGVQLLNGGDDQLCCVA